MMALRFGGVLKLIVLAVLSAGYGWMAYIEKPSAYELPRSS